MSESQDSALQRELEVAHEQLIERDQRINELRIENAALLMENAALRIENAALRTHLESVLATRAWRTAEHLRKLRSRVLRRDV
ncbi:MAG: hypothetical protein EXQ67_09150 [Thermoleophilia bacterium]|nr:hypothetical protein [Thermoleophilia bacterium]